MEQLSIFNMVRENDHATSIDAATALVHKVREMHTEILLLFRFHGPMSDEKLESLSVFDDYGPSTVRKRRSELYQWGYLEAIGTTTNSRGRKMLVFALKEK